MANKRYYWLKLYDDFFSSLRIKKLRKLAGGDTYLAIYLKMQLLAMKSDGILKWSGLEDDFTSELALELDEEPENIKVTLAYLLSCGLAETNDSISYFFPYAVSNVGSEGTSAQRMRAARGKVKDDQIQNAVNDSRTLCAHCATEKEIEIETRDKRQEEDNHVFHICTVDHSAESASFYGAASPKCHSLCCRRKGVHCVRRHCETLLAPPAWNLTAFPERPQIPC